MHDAHNFNSNTIIPKVDAAVFHRVTSFIEKPIDHFCMSLRNACWQDGWLVSICITICILCLFYYRIN